MMTASELRRGPSSWLNQLSMPFLWVMLTPIVTVPLSFSLFFLLAGYHEPQEIGLTSGNGPSSEYFEVSPTIMAFALPGLLNLVPLLWVLSAKPRVRVAGIVAGLLGILRLLIPPLALILFFEQVTSPEGASYFRYSTLRYVAPPPPFVEVWILGFLAWLGTRLAWGTLEWLAPSEESALEPLRRGQQLSAEGQWLEAIAEFDKAIWADPELGEAWKGRAFAYSQRGDVGRAIADLEEALSASGDQAARALIEKEIEELRGQYGGGS